MALTIDRLIGRGEREEQVSDPSFPQRMSLLRSHIFGRIRDENVAHFNYAGESIQPPQAYDRASI